MDFNIFLENRNTLVFEELELRNTIKQILEDLFITDECYYIFNSDIELKPLDSDVRADSYFPCVTLFVINNGVDNNTSDNLQIQNRTKFTVEINIYTTGATKKTDNTKLSKIIEKKLQNKLGLRFLQNKEVNSEVDKVSRRILRATNIIDNITGIIYNY